MISRNKYNLDARNGRTVSLEELILIIDEIKEPCLVLSASDNRILCVNIAFIELSEIGNHEIRNEKINSFIPDFDDLFQEDGRMIQGYINTRSEKKIPIGFSAKGISSNHSLYLVKINPQLPQDDGTRKEAFNNALMDLLSTCVIAEESKLIEQIISTAKRLFNLQECVLYKSDGEVLVRQNASLNFPDKLPLIEKERIQKIDFWYQSKRILCEVHRVARRKKFSGTISSPVNLVDQQGLIVAVINDWTEYASIEHEFDLFIKWVNICNHISSDFNKLQHNYQWSKDQNTLFSDLIENSNDAIIVLNENDLVDYANTRFLSWMGYSSFEVINKNINNLFENQDILAVFLSPEISEKAVFQKKQIHDRAGNDHFVNVVVDNIFINNLQKRIVIIKDVTLEQQLSNSIKKIENQASLGDSIADFAHDVRNPLNNISTGLQLLRKVYQGDQMLAETVDRMQSDCIRMSDLIESVLSFSRQTNSAFGEIDLLEIMEGVFKHFENSFKKANITHALLRNITEAKIAGDYRSIERVLINLINNSVQAMGTAGGELSVILDRNPEDPREFLISIADTGPGIPREMQSNIFEPYVTGKKTGTGLGLSITKRIVEAHHGRIELESYPSGTIFRLFFKEVTEDIA